MVQIIPGGPVNAYRGLSTDEKPTVHVPNGSTFYEFDTVEVYVFDKDNERWIKQE